MSRFRVLFLSVSLFAAAAMSCSAADRILFDRLGPKPHSSSPMPMAPRNALSPNPPRLTTIPPGRPSEIGSSSPPSAPARPISSASIPTAPASIASLTTPPTTIRPPSRQTASRSSSYPHAPPAKPTSGSSTSPAARPPRSPPETAATSAPPGPPTENGSPSRPTATATFAPPRADGSACTWLTCI